MATKSMPTTLSVLSIGYDASLRSTRALLLKSAGYQVASAASMEEAIKLFDGSDFDAVIVCQTIHWRDAATLAAKFLTRPNMGVMIMEAGTESKKSYKGHIYVNSADGPKEFLKAIASLLFQEDKIPLAIYHVASQDDGTIVLPPLKKSAAKA